jgi:trigger factor
MKTTTKNPSPTSVEVTVIIDAEELATYQAEAVEALGANLKVPGFRKGKVPADIARKNLDPNTLSSATLDIAIRSTAPKAFDEAKIIPLATPEVSVGKYVAGEMLEYTAKADIMPEIKLGKYSALKVKRESSKISKKDVDAALENIRKSFSEKQPVKRAAKTGDDVQIDFTGKRDGVAFDGGTAKDFHLELGSGQFIPGFEEGIVGHKTGEEFDIELEFPKDYHAKDLAGVPVVFTVLIKQVNEQSLPALDEKFAEKCGNFKSIEELRADIEKNLQSQNEHKSLEKYKDDLVNALIDGSTVPTPEVLVQDHIKSARQDFEANLARSGMTAEQYLEKRGATMEDWDKELRELAETRVKAALALSELARKESLQASEDETDAKVAELKDVYKNSPEAVKQLDDPRVHADIQHRLTLEKAVDLLVKLNSK